MKWSISSSSPLKGDVVLIRMGLTPRNGGGVASIHALTGPCSGRS